MNKQDETARMSTSRSANRDRSRVDDEVEDFVVQDDGDAEGDFDDEA